MEEKQSKKKLWMLYNADDSSPEQDPKDKKRRFFKIGKSARQVCRQFAKENDISYKNKPTDELKNELAAFSVFPVELEFIQGEEDKDDEFTCGDC
jgi:hypothetical protein